ncbi:MAG: hypothetical protein OXT67_10250 [Zetaproteobacteria bacterium]|nr:hypothetical protein [Zetaproteobacteria bacterium]
MNIYRRGLALTFFACLLTHLALGKPIRELAKTDKGRISQTKQQEIRESVEEAEVELQGDQVRFSEIVADPYSAVTDGEKLLALSQREMFLLIDQSDSMNSVDPNPTIAGNHYTPGWTRWKSAHIAAQSLFELAISLDKDGILDLSFFRGGKEDRHHAHLPACEEFEAKSILDIDQHFDPHRGRRPGGLTPLAEALTYVYRSKLADLLHKSEPFTVFILTDGAPNVEEPVYRFFQKLVHDHRLDQPGRETLAAFSFIRSGDDERAIRFLTILDDGMKSGLDGSIIVDAQGRPVLTPGGAKIRKPRIAGLEKGLGVDIIDSKEDNILFGTGLYAGQENVGPLRVMYDAMFD